MKQAEISREGVWLTHWISGHRTWWQCSSVADAPPKVGGVIPRALEVCASKHTSTTLPVLSKIPQNFAFSRANSKPCSDTM